MNIYVSNLTYTTTEDELSHLFEAYGTVERVSHEAGTAVAQVDGQLCVAHAWEIARK